MKVKMFTLIENAVEKGALYGYRRSFKHQDTPTEEEIVNNIVREIMNELDVYLDFDS